MREHTGDVSRRNFLGLTAGAAAATAATGTAAAAEGGDGGDGGGGGGPPDFRGYLDGANNYGGSVVDARGQSEVTVEVGAGSTGLAFGPAAVHVDNGATVIWEWTGNGGAHNVVADGGAFKSGSPVGEAGTTFEYTFSEDGIYNYYCNPHQTAGMLGSVVVGTDYPTVDTSGSAGPQPLPSSAKTLGVATMFVMASTLGLAYFFLKYGGDYGEFED